jgi:cell division protein FtsA
VLTEQEKNLGVVLVDIGHGTTDISIYVEGSVWHTKVIPIGGWHLTNDLVIVFNIPYEAAEALKLQYGQAAVPGSNRYRRPAEQPVNGKSHPHGRYASVHAGESYTASEYSTSSVVPGEKTEGDYEPDDEMLEAQTFEGTSRPIARGELNEVMAARLDQLLGMVGDEIRRSGYEGLLPAGVVLTGGVAAMPGIEPLASHRLRMPVRIGKPQRIGGLADAFESPDYATSVGLTLWGLKQSTSPQPLLSRLTFSRPKLSDGGQSGLAKWLKRFLPQE